MGLNVTVHGSEQLQVIVTGLEGLDDLCTLGMKEGRDVFKKYRDTWFQVLCEQDGI